MTHVETAIEKGSVERNAAAAQIRRIREIERTKSEPAYITDREAAYYIGGLGGLNATLAHLKCIGRPTIVGLGEGTTRGIFELSRTEQARGLNFHATVLSMPTQVDRYLGRARTHMTSAEGLSLPSIEPGTVGAFLGSNSIAYSAAPELVAYQMDRYLAPGGVIKACFARHNATGDELAFNQRTGFQTADRMEAILEGEPFNYDVVTYDDGISTTLLAVKPGIYPKGFAEELFVEDWNTAPSEEELRKDSRYR